VRTHPRGTEQKKHSAINSMRITIGELKMKISLQEYVSKKHTNGLLALMKLEANCFGIRYPLSSDWYESVCSVDVNILHAALSKVKPTSGSYESAQRGLNVVNSILHASNTRPIP